jgi:hypothetical protein
VKSTIKLFGVIALAVLIGFSMVACDSGDSGNPSNPNNPSAPTGTVWKTAANRSLDADVWDIAYGNNKFVVISKANTAVASKISYSSDGINWTEIPSNYSYRTKEALIIAFGNNTFVVGVSTAKHRLRLTL